MGLTGAAVGFNNALQQILADRYAQQAAEQQYKDRQRQQQFDNDMKRPTVSVQRGTEARPTRRDRVKRGIRRPIGQQRTRGALDDTIPEGAIPYAPEDGLARSRHWTGSTLLTMQDERPP
jgi:hypothetical protein